MNGYSSHTYSWLNDKDELFWVKYHFKTDQGVEFLTQEEGDGWPATTATPPARPVHLNRGRQLPELDAARADHAVRGR